MSRGVEYRVAELERRLNNMVRRCVVSELSGSRVRVTDASGFKSGWLPWFTRRAGEDRDWWAPEPGEGVALLSPNGDPGLGMVLPGLYMDQYPAPADVRTVHRTEYQDGAVVEYDRAGHRLSLTIPGSIVITADQVTVNAPVQVNDTIDASDNITSVTRLAAPSVAGTGAGGVVSAKSVLADGDEVTDHDHLCPACGSRTSILGE